jgi:hypothetical protein
MSLIRQISPSRHHYDDPLKWHSAEAEHNNPTCSYWIVLITVNNP